MFIKMFMFGERERENFNEILTETNKYSRWIRPNTLIKTVLLYHHFMLFLTEKYVGYPSMKYYKFWLYKYIITHILIGGDEVMQHLLGLSVRKKLKMASM